MDDAQPLSGLDRTLGFHYEEFSGDRLIITWTVGEHHLQPYGLLHGGVLCSVVESAASVAGGLWYLDRGQVVGVNNNTNFVRSARPGDRLTATATPLHRGRLQQLWQVEIVDVDSRLIARGEVRLQNLPAAGTPTAQ
jgi:uncharacterized protein (TIGR00369 family)